jgi:hypothetical protein
LSNRGVTDLIKHHRKNAGNHGVVGLLKLFNTKSQNTWLAVTNSNLFCVLDDEDTRSSNRQVQWTMPLWEASPVSVRARPKRAAGLVNIGRRQNWLYSQRLHPDSNSLKTSIQKLIDAGKHA